MTSLHASFRWLVAVLAVALVATAFTVTGQVMTSMADHGHDWWRIFVWQLAGWAFWAPVAPLLLARGRALAEARPWWRALPLTVAAGAGLMALHLLLVAAVVTWVQQFQPVATYSFGEALERQLEAWRSVDLAAVPVLVALGFMLASAYRSRRLELNESRLQADLARAELEALRLQIEPHFLFNTLNTVAALIRRGDGKRALETVLELGELLRETVGRSHRDVTSLAEEWGFARRYVGLQQTRFADRLEVRSVLPAACRELEVPTLSLQPLLENAIRHGLAGRSEKLTLEVEATVEDGQLRLSVRDDGQGLPSDFDLARDAGVGLGNLRSRLRRLYGGGAALELDSAAEGTVATLVVPARPVKTESGAGESGP